MYFRYCVGALIALIGCIALAANSYLLGNGAIRWAHEHDLWERAALAAGGAVVPWLLATFPMLFAIVAAESGILSRLGQRVLIVGLWVIFFFYNFMMGTSNLATLREEKVAAISHSAENLDAKRARKARLENQLAGIPQHRPAETVDRLLAAERANRRWSATEECTNATARASRDFCDNYRTLEGELAAARSADKINGELDALIADIAAAPPATKDSADPFVTEAAAATGLHERTVRVVLAMATPFILEVTGASCWKIAIVLFGWSLRNRSGATGEAAEPDFNPAPLMSPEKANSAPVASFEALTRQRQLAEWVFRECAKPVAGAPLSEREWYEFYCDICRRQKDVPLPVEAFRRIAGRNIGMTISDVGSEKVYFGYMPLIPSEAA